MNYKYIINTEEQYVIFKNGTIYRKERVIIDKNGRVLKLKAYFVKKSLKSNGYYSLNINCKLCYLHRLLAIHFITNDDKTKNIIDHKNRIRTDNNLLNLRWVNNKENCNNNSIRKDNTSGHINLEYDKINKNWRVRYRVNGKRKSKSFRNKIDALNFQKPPDKSQEVQP